MAELFSHACLTQDNNKASHVILSMKLNDRQWLKEAREYFFMVDKEINIYNM
jgi:hypothetical protein